MKDTETVTNKAIRSTLDCIMTRLYQARAIIGGYVGDYISEKRGRFKKDYNDYFIKFARDLATYVIGVDSQSYMNNLGYEANKIRALKTKINDNIDKICRNVMISFL